MSSNNGLKRPGEGEVSSQDQEKWRGKERQGDEEDDPFF